MKKQIKQYGNSLIITFDKEDIDFYNLEVGDWIDLDDIIKVKQLPKNQTKEMIKKEVKK